MAETAVPSAGAEAPRKGLLLRLAVPLLLVVSGAAAGAVAMLFVPELVPQSGGREAPPEPAVAPLAYVEIENSFTANLRDTGRFVQVKIAVSTQGGQPVEEAVKRHHVAIVAAVLAVLAETGEAELTAPGGRETLAKRMRIAINDVLQRKSGIAGVDDVFLTSFVLQ